MDATEARKQIQWLQDNKAKVVVIHYACDDLYDSSAPVRIRHISCMRLQNRQCVGFSFIDVKSRHPNYSDDEIEKTLLEDFSKFVTNNKNKHWLHWHMRSSSYGFNALENRLSILGGNPYSFNLSKAINLADILKAAYGSDYADDPKMQGIGKLNGILPRDFLTGKQEAEAFQQGRLRDISLSCNSKVGMFSEVLALAASNSLKTKQPKVGLLVRIKSMGRWLWGLVIILFTFLGAVNDWFGIMGLFNK